ncbi:MAG: hypothetical protein AUI86_06740 [Gemmatimonadetes bacterium 13_1_40CM_3_66_12]|nr:MAG: hypothetical protein AUI86_06740 [Gemmatimonadetes bacterium 13_1_40CM_3_66_12]
MLARAGEIPRRAVEDLAVRRDRLDELGFELLGGWLDTQVRGARCAVAETLEIGRDDAHGGERDGQLRKCRCFERAAGDIEQLERWRDIGDRLGTDRVVGDQQRGQLGDLPEAGADRGGVGVRKTSGNACRTQGPGGVVRNPRQGLGEFESF